MERGVFGLASPEPEVTSPLDDLYPGNGVGDIIIGSFGIILSTRHVLAGLPGLVERDGYGLFPRLYLWTLLATGV